MQTTLVMAALRQRLLEYAVADLAVGESVYLSPAALIVAPDRACRLRTDPPIQRAVDADATLHIRRTSRGYIADITLYAYHLTSVPRIDNAPRAVVEHIVFGDEFLQ